MAGIVSFGQNSSNRPITVNQQTVTGASASDVAYGASWNGSLDAPTKNAVYDKIETLTSYTDEQAQDAVGAMVDTTLTYTDATPLLGVNLANANSWTAAQTQLRTSLGATTDDGWVLDNTTNAANGAQKVSPALRFRGRGWNSGGGGSSQTIDFRQFVAPEQGASGAHGLLKTQMNRNGAGYFDVWSVDTRGQAIVTTQPGTGATTGLEISHPFTNSAPGSTRALRLASSGTYNEIDFTYAGTLREAILANTSGDLAFYASGGSYFSFYAGNSGLTSNSMFAYLNPTALVHSQGYIVATGAVGAGSIAAPTSTLQSAGGTALKVKRVGASQSLDNTASHWLADATTAAACTGTPSVTTCSTYTASGQATCESHLPCVWNAGNACSAFDGDVGTCGGTSGCTVDTASCEGAGDQTSCEAQDDSYGGSCTWDFGTNTCPMIGDTATCNSASPCYATTSDCSSLSDGGGDGTNCATQPECSYDSGSGACTGSYFVSCDGDNSTPSCTGTYNTGTCSGSYGTACTGTVTCTGYGSSGACAAEAGCSWATVLNLTLPDGETCPDRTYWVKNDTSGGQDVVILPFSGQTVEKASSLTLANYQDAVHLAYYKQTYDCANYVTAETCTPTGCTINNAYCSWDSGDLLCYGDGGSVCSAHNGNQSNCEAQTYFHSCSGMEIVAKNWYVF